MSSLPRSVAVSPPQLPEKLAHTLHGKPLARSQLWEHIFHQARPVSPLQQLLSFSSRAT